MLARPDLLVPLVLFAIVSLYTPGPNNLMLMTSGLNHGLKKTWPHILGITLGFPFQVLCVGLGLGAIFKFFPIIYILIKYTGAAYMLYLAWMIARSEPPQVDETEHRKPMTLFQAAAFQWVNAKAWVLAIGVTADYAAIADYPCNMLLMSGLFVVLGFTSCLAWAALGLGLQKFLHRPKIVRAFNISMAMLLAASLYPVIADAWH